MNSGLPPLLKATPPLRTVRLMSLVPDSRESRWNHKWGASIQVTAALGLDPTPPKQKLEVPQHSVPITVSPSAVTSCHLTAIALDHEFIVPLIFLFTCVIFCVIFLYPSVCLKTAHHHLVALLLFCWQSNKLTVFTCFLSPFPHTGFLPRNTKVYVTFLKGMVSSLISIFYILVLFLLNKEFLIASILQTSIF